MKHHPWLYRASRHGCWTSCSCGWLGRWRWTTVVGAHLEYGRHLIETSEDR